MNWLSKQWEWIKSFLSEPANGDGIQKGSNKRMAASAITFTFVFTYLRIAMEMKIMPDIPDTWIFILAAVLGITGVVDYMKARAEKK